MGALPRIDPVLVNRVASLPGSTPVRVLVTFTDTVTMPPFPRLRSARPRTDPLNVALLDSAASIINEIELRRRARYAVDTLALKGFHQARILDHFWLIQACAVEPRAAGAAVRIVDSADQPIRADGEPEQGRSVRDRQHGLESAGAGTGAGVQRVPVEEHQLRNAVRGP